MVLKLYGLDKVSCTKRVRVVLEELGVPYEFITVDIFKGKHKSPEHKKHHPFGLIPYMDDDGFELFESRAICRYVALKYGGKGTLIPNPDDLQKTARFEQAASIETSNFDPYATGLAVENLIKPFEGGKTNHETVKAYEATFERKLEGYDALLSKTKFLAGDDMTIVDLFHLSYGSLLKLQGYDYLESEKYPHVARWWKDISSRPAWKKVNVDISAQLGAASKQRVKVSGTQA